LSSCSYCVQGKTAIAEGLAISIVSGRDHRGREIPSFLRSKRVLQLDVGLLISGSKERGELEKRITNILEESLQAGNIILVYVILAHTPPLCRDVGLGGHFLPQKTVMTGQKTVSCPFPASPAGDRSGGGGALS
jgi:hypothetical protein